MRAWSGILSVGLSLWLVACGAPNLPPSSRAAETPFLATSAPTSEAIVTPTRVPAPTQEAPPDAIEQVELTLWVPEEFGPGAERGGDILASQIAEFEAAFPHIHLNYVLKAPYGKGGMVDWLLQLNELMPDRLPDAAIVDSRELDQLEKPGLLQPLNRDLPSGALWDLFQPAQSIARRAGQWDNQPLVLDTEHLAYDGRRVSIPPLSWQDVLSGTSQIAFAADSTESFMFQYLENGGSLDAAEHPTTDTGVVEAILDYIQRARASGKLNASAAGIKSARDVMPLLLSGQVPMAQVRARDFLAERSRLPNALVAPVPTRDGRASALTSSWSFVVLDRDEGKRKATLEYLAWIIDPARMGEWAGAARLVPASKSAFAEAMAPAEYVDVMWKLLEDARVAPEFSKQEPYAAAWHAAVTGVLSGQMAPDDAAFRAVQAITQ